MSNLEKLKKKLLIYRIVYYIALIVSFILFVNIFTLTDFNKYMTLCIFLMLFVIVVFIFGKLIKKLKKNIYDISVIKSAIEDSNKS